ncbi:hypothetical protein AB3R30_03745 [Leptolyngbyaceae cyanobacterium UHCC 1019]
MTWKAYQVVFKLKSPMHIGCGKVGNVQRTRPYVTGRVFWGALTMRLTRDKQQPAINSKQYQDIGDEVHKRLAYTYFYPAIKQNGDYQIQWSWGDKESLFRRRFLSSYTSTALMYPQQAADEGLLHEVEFLSPRTLDQGKQVYLVGYVFEQEDCNLQWQVACHHLQFGGERGYGWGDVQLQCTQKCTDPEKQTQKCIQEVTDSQLFDANYRWTERNDRIVIQVPESMHLLAHTVAQNVSAKGEIEPLVGREWKVSTQAGQHVEKFVDDLCWVPGSIAIAPQRFEIQQFGIWHPSK